MRQPRPVVIVFAKAPRLGAVKTRLARDIGGFEAWRFHRLALARTLLRLCRDRRWRVVLALTPDALAHRCRAAPMALARLGQGRGNLGRRMARALDRFRPGPVLLVGGDIPALEAGHVAQALARLRAAHVVFGPAADGGYWLVGVRGRRRALALFRNVRWSTPGTLSDSLANVAPGQRLALAATLRDVDTGADYACFRDGDAVIRRRAPRARGAAA